MIPTTLFVVAFYVNQPHVVVSPDTDSYLRVAAKIRERGDLTDLFRTPGYPMFISLVFALFGNDNLHALSIAQGVLYVATAVEVYVIVYLIAERVWIATTVALVASINTYELSYSKAVLVEGFALWCVVTLLLAVVLFVRAPRVRLLWAVAAMLLLALMTRPEWLYAPVVVFTFLVLAARGVGASTRRLLLHACAATVVIYAIVGLYIATNGAKDHYGPYVVIPRIVMLGKVMEYRMQHRAPAKYADVTRRIDEFLATEGDQGPYVFLARNPDLADVQGNLWKPAGDYARAVIMNAPTEYLWKTIKLMHTGTNYRWAIGKIDRDRPFGRKLSYLEGVSAKIYDKYQYFPLFAGVALALFVVTFFRPVRGTRPIRMMAALAFLGLYQLFMASAGGYADWPRLFSTLNPNRIIVVFGSSLILVGVALRAIEQRARPRLRSWSRLMWATWLATLVVALVLLAIAVSMTRFHPTLRAIYDWAALHPFYALALFGVWTWSSLVVRRSMQHTDQKEPLA